MYPMRTRFAPSPTGYLHLGHVVNAIVTWGVTRATGGQVWLRIEDHDRIRCRPHFEAALLDDLAWLGFVPDAGLSPLVRQSDRVAIYEAALARLRDSHRVYVCDCSRKRVGGERYDGQCRARGLTETAGTGLRVRLDDGEETFVDRRLGPQRQCPADDCGDVLVRDRDGHWTYQFAVTVDDIDQAITHVIRGEDLLSSTGRQLQLMRLLGHTAPPRYLHHPLLHGADGAKLSKSAGDTGVRDLRAAGLSAAEVIGRAAHLSGLTPTAAPVAASDVHVLFSGWR